MRSGSMAPLADFIGCVVVRPDGSQETPPQTPQTPQQLRAEKKPRLNKELHHEFMTPQPIDEIRDHTFHNIPPYLARWATGSPVKTIGASPT